jgi:hypothetical protein
MLRTERSISSVGRERMPFLFNSSNLSRRLPLHRGIFQFLNNESRTSKINLHTEEQKNREIPKVVEDR